MIERPSYGYELIQRFRRTYGDTLALSGPRQIYTALNALRTRGLIEETRSAAPPSAPHRQPRPNYRATAEGVRGYEEWLLIQFEEERQRQRLFARQLAMLDPQVALEVIDRYEEECLTEADETTVAESERESVAHRLADRDEQLGLEARLSWIRYARRELTTILEQPASEAGPGEKL